MLNTDSVTLDLRNLKAQVDSRKGVRHAPLTYNEQLALDYGHRSVGAIIGNKEQNACYRRFLAQVKRKPR